MNVKTLAEMPQKLNECIELIENSFDYDNQHTIKEDFNVLFEESNFENCYFLLEQDEVVSTLFTLPRRLKFKDQSIPVLFIGGISVRDENRGAGIFRSFLETILLLNQDNALFLLWSDLSQLYEKFNFFEFGLIEEIDLRHEDKDKLKHFTDRSIETIIQDYQKLSQTLMIPERSEHEWHLLLQSKSIDILESETGSIYMVNKGMDLQNICHEYHPQNSSPIKGFINWRLTDGTPKSNNPLRYMGFVRLGNVKYLNNMIEKTSNGRLKLISHDNGMLKVQFDQEEYNLPEKDFVQGIWGPGKVTEWQGLVPDIFIPGFDSI